MGIWGYGAAIQLGSERRATVSVFIWCLIGFSIIHYYWLQFTWRPAQNSSYPVALIAFHQRMEWIWIWGCLSHQFSNSSNSNCIIKRNFWFWFSPPPLQFHSFWTFSFACDWFLSLRTWFSFPSMRMCFDAMLFRDFSSRLWFCLLHSRPP